MSTRERHTTFCASIVRRTAMMRSRKRAAASKLKCSAASVISCCRRCDQRVVMAFEKQHDFVDEHVVVGFGLVADARRETALDVVLQARPFALAVDRLAAGAQRKDDAHEVDQLAQAGGVRVGAEVARAVVAHDAREHDARERLVRDLEIREALVVAQPHVERRLMALDQVRFEDQRFDLVRDDDRAHVDDALDHLHRAVRVRGAVLEVRAHAAAQRDGLADIQNLPVVPDHHIDAGRVGELGQRPLQRRVELGHVRYP